MRVVKNRNTVGITVILLHEKSSFSSFSLHISTKENLVNINEFVVHLRNTAQKTLQVKAKNHHGSNSVMNNNILCNMI